MFPFIKQHAQRPGRTFIELLVVLGILAVAFTIFLPLLQRAHERARRHVCAHHLRQIGQADLRHEEFQGNLVPARLGPDSTSSREVIHLRTPVERSGASGFTLMLPYLEKIPQRRRDKLVDYLDVFENNGIWPAGIFNAFWRTPERERAIGARLRLLVCPTARDRPRTEIEAFQEWETAPATGNYAFVAGHRGINYQFPVSACLVKHHNTGAHLYWTTYSLAEIEDGASKTISVGEVIDSHTPESSNIWTYGLRYLDCFRVTDLPLNTLPGENGVSVGTTPGLVNGAFASRHPRGANFAYCDGHVRFMRQTIDFELYQNLSTIAGTPEYRDQVDLEFCQSNGY